MITTERAFTVCRDEQRSSGWFQARAGRLTASRAADMLKPGKGSQEAAGRRNLKVQLVLERITGKPQESGFVSPAMQAGIEREPLAYAHYEALTGTFVERTGFLSHNTLMVGCSLDGHVGDYEGLIEIKCPQPSAMLDVLKSAAVPLDYQKQVTHALWVTGAQWADVLFFNPDFPTHLQGKLLRVERDEAAIRMYEQAALTFLAEVDAEVDAMKELG